MEFNSLSTFYVIRHLLNPMNDPKEVLATRDYCMYVSVCMVVGQDWHRKQSSLRNQDNFNYLQYRD